MRRLYWNCEVQKNWDGTLREDMLAQNIVCYGKPGTGKTQKVIMPFLRQAVARNNSVLLITSSDRTDYSEIITMAWEQGYEAVWENADISYFPERDFDGLMKDGLKLLTELMEKPCFLRVQVNPNRRHQLNTLEALLYHLVTEDLQKEASVPMRNLSLVMEDSNWEVSIPRHFSENRWMNFCITMDSTRLNPSDMTYHREQDLVGRRDVLSTVPQSKKCHDFSQDLARAVLSGDHVAAQDVLDKNIAMGDHFGCVSPINDKDNFHLVEGCTRRVTDEEIRRRAAMGTRNEVRRFFGYVQTVICTGAGGISPQEHKAFLTNCVVSPGVAAPSGKYLVTDLSSPSQPVRKSVIPKTVLALKKMDIEKVLRCHDFLPGRVVMEQNGVVKMFAGYNGEIVPFVFLRTAEALEWLEHYFAQMGWGWPEPVEMDSCTLRYLLPSVNDNGQQDEITISYIQREDIDSYVDQTMMVLMEVEEYLTKPELMQEIPNLDKSEEANVTLQKVVNYSCRNYKRVRKLGNAVLPVDAETQKTAVSMIEEYRWRPYEKVAAQTEAPEPKAVMDILPQKRVLFLGGHANMVKKLRQVFPGWDFLTDDELGSWTGSECEVIFFWSAHCSHLIWQYVNARKGKDTPYLYVTATNINRLVAEMAMKYREYQQKKALLPA